MMMKQYINDNWKFKRKDQDDESVVSVRLPHTNVETPYQYFDESIYQFESCYIKVIFIKKEWEQQHIFLCFEAVGHIARVYVNDRFVGEHFGGYTSFSFDIAPYVSFG
ncbi:MAG: glycoside hydrolase family 2 protein, partial [Eubacteriales bacterium]